MSVCIVSLRNGVYYVPEKALPVSERGFMACRKRLSCMAVEAMSVPRNVYSVDYQYIPENAENSRICLQMRPCLAGERSRGVDTRCICICSHDCV